MRVKDEGAPLDPAPASITRETLAALRHPSRRPSSVRGASRGDRLRNGGFNGPGTSLAHDGEMLEAVRKRLFPIIGSGGGMTSFIHVEDAACATFAAIERGKPGV